MSLLVMVAPMLAVSVSTAATVSPDTSTVVDALPSTSCTFTEFACSGMMVRSLMTFA